MGRPKMSWLSGKSLKNSVFNAVKGDFYETVSASLETPVYIDIQHPIRDGMLDGMALSNYVYAELRAFP